jgi:hypothetical protein
MTILFSYKFSGEEKDLYKLNPSFGELFILIPITVENAIWGLRFLTRPFWWCIIFIVRCIFNGSPFCFSTRSFSSSVLVSHRNGWSLSCAFSTRGSEALAYLLSLKLAHRNIWSSVISLSTLIAARSQFKEPLLAASSKYSRMRSIPNAPLLILRSRPLESRSSLPKSASILRLKVSQCSVGFSLTGMLVNTSTIRSSLVAIGTVGGSCFARPRSWSIF